MKLRAFATTVVFLSLAAGCSSSAGSDSDGLRSITIAVVPITESAAVYVAKEEGYFADEGLDVSIEEGATSAAILPGVVSGHYSFGMSNLVGLMLARSQGLDLTAIAAASQPTSPTESFSALVAKDPEITTGADLAGKKVAVNALESLASVELWAQVKADGGEPEEVEPVELGFGDQTGALERGEVDAALTVEPFLSQAVAAGMHVVGYPDIAIDPDIVIAGYVTTGELADEDPELVASFRSAVYRAAEKLTEDPAVIEEAVREFSDLDPTVYADMALPRFPTTLPESAAQTWAALMVASGMVSTEPDLTGLIGN